MIIKLSIIDSRWESCRRKCIDPVKTCSGDNLGNHHEHEDGRRDQTVDSQA